MMDSRRTKKPERRGPLRRLGGIGSRLLSNRAFLRVFSVFAAVAVWFFMVASDGTLTLLPALPFLLMKPRMAVFALSVAHEVNMISSEEAPRSLATLA